MPHPWVNMNWKRRLPPCWTFGRKGHGLYVFLACQAAVLDSISKVDYQPKCYPYHKPDPGCSRQVKCQVNHSPCRNYWKVGNKRQFKGPLDIRSTLDARLHPAEIIMPGNKNCNNCRFSYIYLDPFWRARVTSNYPKSTCQLHHVRIQPLPVNLELI